MRTHLQEGGAFYKQAKKSQEAGNALEDITFYYGYAYIDYRTSVVLLDQVIKASVPYVVVHIYPVSYKQVMELPEHLEALSIELCEINELGDVFQNGRIPVYLCKITE